MSRALILVLALASCRADRKPEDEPAVAPQSAAALPTPSGPVKADALIKQVRDNRTDLTVSRIEAKYVRSDGVMDPTYGDLTINMTGKPERPRPPPDDPNRPTGAPVPVPPAPAAGPDCEDFHWMATGGWGPRQDPYMKMCLGIGTPTGVRCTVIQIWQRALADGAPANAVAKVSVIGGIGWTFSIDDDPRDVHFYQTYDDNCAPAAEAGPP